MLLTPMPDISPLMIAAIIDAAYIAAISDIFFHAADFAAICAFHFRFSPLFAFFAVFFDIMSDYSAAAVADITTPIAMPYAYYAMSFFAMIFSLLIA